MKAEIKCLHSEVWPIDRIKPNPRNPNTHPDAQVTLLARIIVESGWRNPIVVSARSGLVVKGHGRLAAARKAGLTECPVEIQPYGSDAEELADLIADNRIAELSERDDAKVLDVLNELASVDVPTTQAGYTNADFEALKMELAESSERTRRVGAPSFQYNIIFRDEAQLQEWFAFIRRVKAEPTEGTIAEKILAFAERHLKGANG